MMDRGQHGLQQPPVCTNAFPGASFTGPTRAPTQHHTRTGSDQSTWWYRQQERAFKRSRSGLLWFCREMEGQRRVTALLCSTVSGQGLRLFAMAAIAGTKDVRIDPIPSSRRDLNYMGKKILPVETASLTLKRHKRLSETKQSGAKAAIFNTGEASLGWGGATGSPCLRC